MKILKKWNKRVYINNNVLDGTMWNLYFTYDNTAIVSRGRNGFPSNFLDYLNILHQKYSVPEAKFENDKWIMQDIKHTKIIDSPDIDSWAMYL